MNFFLMVMAFIFYWVGSGKSAEERYKFYNISIVLLILNSIYLQLT